MSKKTIAIAFTNGGHIPADIAKTKNEKDLPVDPHTAVNVPEAYGLSLIADRLAYAWSVDAERAAAKRQETSQGSSLDLEQIRAQAVAIIDAANKEASLIKDAATQDADAVRAKTETDVQEIKDKAAQDAEKIITIANLSGQLISAQAELSAAQTPEDKAAAQKMVDDAQLALKQAE